MNVRSVILTGVAGLGIFGAGILVGQGPLPPNVDPGRHPNLAAAQVACDQAYAKLIDAQRVNHWDMAGHAARAQKLLADATREIRWAAMDLDKNRR